MLNWFIVIFRFTISFSCCSVAQLRLTLCDPMDCSTPGLPVPRHLPEFAQVRIHCISDAIQPSHPLTPSSPSALSFSQHRELFQWAVYITWPKSWSFSFSISSSSEYSGLISLKIDWFDLLALQGTFRSPLQHHSLKASVLWNSAFFTGPTLTTVYDHWEDYISWLYPSTTLYIHSVNFWELDIETPTKILNLST